jgi:signal transduction histidine kinase
MTVERSPRVNNSREAAREHVMSRGLAGGAWRPGALAGVTAVAGCLTLAAVVVGLLGSGEVAGPATNAGWTSAAVCALAGSLTAALAQPPSARARTAWLLFASAAGCWLAGAVIRDVQGTGPLSAPVVVAWTGFAALSIAGLARRLPRLYVFGVFLLDAIPVTLLVVALAAAAGPGADGLDHRLFLRLFAGLYVLLAANAVQLTGLHSAVRRLPASVWLFTAGFVLMALAGLLWVPGAIAGASPQTQVSGPLWSLGLLAVGAAGVVRALRGSQALRLPPYELQSGPHALPPAAAVLAMIILLPFTPAQDRLMLEVFLLVSAVALIARVYLMRREDLRLLAELVRSRREAQQAAARAQAQQEQLAVQNERLRELDLLKDEFVALVSHELRTPLTSIIGYLELMEDEEQDSDQRRCTDVIRRNTQRLLHLVGDLLFLSRIQSGALSLDLGETDLTEVIEHAIEETRPAASAKGITLSLSARPLPPLRADAIRLAQLAANLLSNAVKFTPAQGRVAISVKPDGGAAVLTIADTGIGISPDDQRHVFERFYRAPSVADLAIQGTGLGLTISKAIVEAHDGSISVDSDPGRGTTVLVRIPLGPAGPPGVPAQQAGRGRAAESATAGLGRADGGRGRRLELGAGRSGVHRVHPDAPGRGPPRRRTAARWPGRCRSRRR